MENSTVKFEGVDEFTKALESIREKYPDEAESLLRKLMLQFRKDVKSKTPVGKSRKKSNKKLINRYKISRLQYMRGAVWTEFSAVAPHYHLMERGFKHMSGKSVGGIGMVKNTEKEYEGKLPDAANRMYNDLLKKIGK